jgi:hypothetical protein
MKTLACIAAAALALAPAAGMAMPYCPSFIEQESRNAIARTALQWDQVNPNDGSANQQLWADQKEMALSTLEMNLKLLAIEVGGCQLVLPQRYKTYIPRLY